MQKLRIQKTRTLHILSRRMQKNQRRNKKMRKNHFVLDKPVKHIYNLNQLKVGDCLTGIPRAEYYKNKKGHQFIRIDLDYGYAVCKIYCLIFDFPEQKILNSKYHNSFQLVKYYRECNRIPVDPNISLLHDINWHKIIDWINQEQIMKIQVISKNIQGFRNIRFLNPKI